MSSVETEQMSAVETGQMTAAETHVFATEESPGPILVDQSSGPISKHALLPEVGRESTVWPETCSRSMPGLCRSIWDGSNPLQGAVPGLVLEVHVGSTMSVRAQIIENELKWVENRPFRPKQRPNESCGMSGPIRNIPEAINGLKTVFMENYPGGRPAAPSEPVS